VYQTSLNVDNGMIFYKGINSTHNHQYYLRVEKSGVNFANVCQSMNEMFRGYPFELNRWYHVAGVFDGQKKQIYVNGEKIGKSDPEFPTGNCTLRSLNSTVVVGYGAEWQGAAFGGSIQHARISNVARTDFSYALITTEPEVKAGSLRNKPGTGTVDLAVLNLKTYPNSGGGLIVQALVQNQGNASTGNEVFTDIYLNHTPTGAKDYTGSVHFWSTTPIAAGATITLTTVLTPGVITARANPRAKIAEQVIDVAMQADSVGVISETDKTNNITNLSACLSAANDSYEGDNAINSAREIKLDEVQTHNFTQISDQDWLKFTAQADKSYLIQTLNLDTAADTTITLYDLDQTTVITSNDDYSGTLASAITWTAPKSGVYYIKVTNWNPNVKDCGTSYDVTVKETVKRLAGDVNCDGQRTIIDAMFILQYDIGSRTSTNQCPISTTELATPSCDVNNDGQCNVIDAMFILQCDIGIANVACAVGPQAVASQDAVSHPLTSTVSLSLQQITVGQAMTVTLTGNVLTGTLGATSLGLQYPLANLQIITYTVDPRNQFDLMTTNPNLSDTLRFNLVSAKGITGTWPLATLSFKMSHAVSTPLTVTIQTMVDVYGQPILAKAESGLACIGQCWKNNQVYLPVILAK